VTGVISTVKQHKIILKLLMQKGVGGTLQSFEGDGLP